jgi:exopolyphosphatase/guanosine-5'-triphosphate,3'-diphosphate pyrophosphatase
MIDARRSAFHRSPRRRQPKGRWGHTFAALDLGTNNCRLLVAKPSADGFRVIDSFSRIVRLGEGIGTSGRLADPAIDRTIGALWICAKKMERREVSVARCVATQACRQASNGAEFLARVRKEIGLTLEIIDPSEEARLAVAGCAPLLEREHASALVFDIGGGSTEIMWLALARHGPPEVRAWTSLPIGVVTLAEQHGGQDVSAAAYGEMKDAVLGRIAPFERDHGLREVMTAGGTQVLGTSGTVTTLAALRLDLLRYDRNAVDGCWLAAQDIDTVSRRLFAMTYEERSRHPCIGRGRADLVIAGCAIFEAIFETWPAPRVRVADRGVRDGMLFHLMEAADTGTLAAHCVMADAEPRP